MKIINTITQLFPLWAVLLSTLAFFQPDFFITLKPYIIPLLIIVMLGMGFTLTWRDFKHILHDPKIILLGVVLQYFVGILLEVYGISMESVMVPRILEN